MTPKDYKSGGRISEEDMNMILDAANWAPTHNKTQPWRYVMLSGMVSDCRVGTVGCGLYAT